jgi:hypothetical protein
MASKERMQLNVNVIITFREKAVIVRELDVAADYRIPEC